jgi:hypothetical protein
MTKIIKAAAQPQDTLTKGQIIIWWTTSFDGRGYETEYYAGTITRINAKTVNAEDTKGNIWLVDKTRIKK